MTKNKGTNLFVFRPFSLFLFFKYSPFPSSTCFVLLLRTENQQTLCVPVLQSGSRSPLPCESPTWCSQSVRDPVLHFDTLPPSLEDGADAPKVQVPAGPRALLSQRCSPERRLDLNREIIPQRAVPSSVHPSKNDRSVPPAPPLRPPKSTIDRNKGEMKKTRNGVSRRKLDNFQTQSKRTWKRFEIRDFIGRHTFPELPRLSLLDEFFLFYHFLLSTRHHALLQTV